MSNDDLIRRGDVLSILSDGKATWGEAAVAVRALPARCSVPDVSALRGAYRAALEADVDVPTAMRLNLVMDWPAEPK